MENPLSDNILSDYERFIKSKLRADVPAGFDCDVPVGPLFDFQAACVKWALKRGRAALFEDTGLGKTAQQVAWAQAVCEHTGGNVEGGATAPTNERTRLIARAIRDLWPAKWWRWPISRAGG